MDCNTAQSLMMDELYGELAPAESADFHRHLSGCAACDRDFRGFERVRSEARVPAIEVPQGLADRIMARVDATPRVVPLRSRASRVLSTAGAWAMRPQTAMAAVFLLMVGSSAWLLRRQGEAQYAPAIASERGLPLSADAPQGADGDGFDVEAARGAHGMGGERLRAGPAATAASPPPQAAQASRKSAAADSYAFDDAPAAPAAAPALGEAKASARSEASPEREATGGARDFAGAMQTYRSGAYDDATEQFDALAKQGDQQAALMAARSVRERHGCKTAVTRFDHLASSSLGTPAGNDATLDAALCYRRLGLIESSTQRLQRLLAYDGYAARARTEIETNRRILVARREGNALADSAPSSEPAAGAGGGASVHASDAPAAKPAAPAKSKAAESTPAQR